jgi:hypothetical protein
VKTSFWLCIYTKKTANRRSKQAADEDMGVSHAMDWDDIKQGGGWGAVATSRACTR